jgi:putative hemolysin
MMLIPEIILVPIIYYLGYVLSLYSAAAYLESEELEEIHENLTGFKKKFLSLIIERPRVSIQIATIFKSFALVMLSLIAILITRRFAGSLGLPELLPYAIVLIVAWMLYLIFIEYLPRRRVMRASEKDIVGYISLFAAAYYFFKPLLWLYDRTLSLSSKEPISEDQKEDLVERAIETLAEQSGVDEPIIEEDEKEMIGQIFQLDVTEVREVMVPRINIKGIDKNCTLDDIRRTTRELGFSRYPVYNETIDKIIGILYVKDLFTGVASDDTAFDIKNYIREPFFVPESKKISGLLTEFKANRVHIAIVIDEYGGTSGLVTLEDILEEIVGEIQDEHDTENPQFVKLPDSSFRVDASLPLEELTDELDLDYDIKEFETVGGMIYDLVGSVPSPGATIRWKDILFEIENVEGQRIVTVKAWLKKGNGA